MNFLDRVNIFCRRLWRDESGVVLALTVVVFLSLFVIACSVYAVGENIRQRIELQNAADAAAYSAAVVQADALSRVATLNKAMAWTYVQMCRRQMDYILHKWLRRVSDVYLQDRRDRISLYGTLPFSGTGSWCENPTWARGQPRRSWIGEEGRDQQVRLNMQDWYWYSIWEVQNKAYGFDLEGVRGQIDEDRKTIDQMGKDENYILYVLPDKIRETVRYVLLSNVAANRNDAIANNASADIRFALLQSQQPEKDYCVLYDDEGLFLNAANATSEDMKEGHDTWFPGPRSGEKWSRKRKYQQWGSEKTGRWLVAEWKSLVQGWRAQWWSKACGRYSIGWYKDTMSRQEMYWGKNRGVTALQSPSDTYFETVELQPRRLQPSFFKRAGALIVGVARRANNPLSFMAVDPSLLGIYGFFSSNPNNSYSWAAAASRAGYYAGGEKKEEKDAGKYDPMTPAWTTTPKNLSETDWDAVLVPLRQAWGGDGNGVAILSELWGQAEWRALADSGQSVNGLRSIAGGNGALSFGDESVLH